MNDFTKEELIYLLKCADPQHGIEFEPVCKKLHSQIYNNLSLGTHTTIGTGNILFHNKHCATGIIPEITRQIYLCDNQDESMGFLIEWKIIHGKKFGR